MTMMKLRVVSFSLLMGLSQLASAQLATDWQAADLFGDATGDNLSAETKSDFWKKRFATLCEKAKIPIHFSVGPSVFDFSVKYERYLQRLPHQLYLVDRAPLKFSIGDKWEVIDMGRDGFFDVGFNVRWEGESQIVRPLKDRQACHQLDRLIDPSDFKVVIPATANRMSRMRTGEIWKLPIAFQMTLNPRIGYSHSGVSAVLTLTAKKRGQASITLNRLSANEMRFRMQLGHLKFQALGAKVQVNFGATDWGKSAEDAFDDTFGKTVGGAAFGQLDHFMKTYLAYDLQKKESGELVTEFIINPKDDEQMQALEELLNGNIKWVGVLAKLTKDATDQFWNRPDEHSKAIELADELSGQLGMEDTFTGLMDSTSTTSTLRLKLPFIGEFKWSKTGNKLDQITVIDDYDENYRIYGAVREKEADIYQIPFIGSLLSYKAQDSIMIAGHLDPKDSSKAPIAVYVQQEGFINFGDNTVRGMIEGANQIMQFAGVRGNGTNARTILPLDLDLSDKNRTYQRGLSAFTVVLTDKAMQQIRSASPLDVYSSYVNSLSDNNPAKSAMMSPSVRVTRDGIDYEETKLIHEYRLRMDDIRLLRDEFDTVGKLVNDIALTGSNKDGDPLTTEQQSAAWRDMMAGNSAARLPYNDLMKVIVQLVEPQEMSAEFFFFTDDKEPSKQLQFRYLLYPDSKRVQAVQEINDVLSHFHTFQDLWD